MREVSDPRSSVEAVSAPPRHLSVVLPKPTERASERRRQDALLEPRRGKGQEFHQPRATNSDAGAGVGRKRVRGESSAGVGLDEAVEVAAEDNAVAAAEGEDRSRTPARHAEGLDVAEVVAVAVAEEVDRGKVALGGEESEAERVEWQEEGRMSKKDCGREEGRRVQGKRRSAAEGRRTEALEEGADLAVAVNEDIAIAEGEGESIEVVEEEEAASTEVAEAVPVAARTEGMVAAVEQGTGPGTRPQLVRQPFEQQHKQLAHRPCTRRSTL